MLSNVMPVSGVGSGAGDAGLPPPHAAVVNAKTTMSTKRGTLQIDDDCEAAVRHPLHVEWHRLFHHLLHPRILHHLLVHAVAMGPRYRASLFFGTANKNPSTYAMRPLLCGRQSGSLVMIASPTPRPASDVTSTRMPFQFTTSRTAAGRPSSVRTRPLTD